MIDMTVRSRHPLEPTLWYLVVHTGHARCNGWTFEGRTGLLRCVCGIALYEFKKIDRQSDCASAYPSNAAREAGAG